MFRSTHALPSSSLHLIEVESGIFTLPSSLSTGCSLYLSDDYKRFGTYVRARADLIDYIRQALFEGWSVMARLEPATTPQPGNNDPGYYQISNLLVREPGTLEALLTIADVGPVSVSELSLEEAPPERTPALVAELAALDLVQGDGQALSLTARGQALVLKLRRPNSRRASPGSAP